MTARDRGPGRLALACGAGLFWAVQLTLLLALDLELLDSLLVAVLTVGVPALGLWQVPLVDEMKIERIPAYAGSIVTLWLLGGAAWLVGGREGGAAALGVTAMPCGRAVAWSVGLTAAAFGIILAFRAVAALRHVPDARLLRELLPRTPGERGVFAVLSVAAGTCEELAYRGYFLGVTVPVLGTAGAVVVGSAAFGVVHAYQGRLGMVRTATMGAVLAWGYLASGSLVPVMIAHMLIDLLGGIAFGERLLSPERPSGVARGSNAWEPAKGASPWK